MLPEEDGLTILNSIRQTPAYSEIPVIMVTAKQARLTQLKGLIWAQMIILQSLLV